MYREALTFKEGVHFVDKVLLSLKMFDSMEVQEAIDQNSTMTKDDVKFIEHYPGPCPLRIELNSDNYDQIRVGTHFLLWKAVDGNKMEVHIQRDKSVQV